VEGASPDDEGSGQNIVSSEASIISLLK